MECCLDVEDECTDANPVVGKLAYRLLWAKTDWATDSIEKKRSGFEIVRRTKNSAR